MIYEQMLTIAARVGAPLGNHIWQSTVFVGIVYLATALLRKNRPSVRYALWTAASVKFLLPFSLLVGFGAVLSKAVSVSTESHTPLFSALLAANQPFDSLHAISSSDGQPGLTKPRSALLLEAIVAVWICGTLAILLVWYLRSRQLASHLRLGESADGGREAEILRSLQSEWKQGARIPVVRTPAMMEPGIFGIVRPTLLWPEQLTAQLHDQHVRAILIHELAHVRRRDNLTAAMHMIVEALFWFHPLVWWIESRMVKERECACDDEVILATAPEVYAESLLKTCRFCVESPLSCVSGMAGADLRNRVTRIMTHRRGAHLSRTRKVSLVAASLAVLAAPTSFGLIEGMQSTKSLLHPAVSPPAFEVATIKPNNDPQAGLRIDMSPSDFNAIGGSLKDLIEYAYNVNSQDQVQGEPSWISSRRFDIHAKASESTIASFHYLSVMQQMTELRLMLQSLLVDRFQLKVSFKTADLPVYALVVAKGGPKFKEVEPDPLPPPGTTPRPGAHLPRLGKTGANQYTAVASDMSSLADFLPLFDEVGHRIVVDETGLKGHYDYVLNGISVFSSSDEPTTSIFTALEEQLGLKLEPRKAPVEVLVIERVEPPSEN